MRSVGCVLWQVGLPLMAFADTGPAAPAAHSDLLTSVGLCIGVAAILAVLASKFKQPSILAYLAAGVLIGPEIGLRWITDQQAIEVIAEVGLLLLLFIIGLEIDLKKLRAYGRPVVVIGLSQFLLCTGLGLVFFSILGFGLGQDEALGGGFAPIYMAATAALSSTLVVVKLLYDKFELDTLPGRITLGVLVFQDIWAILLLALQPNLLNPQLGPLLASLLKGLLLVVISLIFSRYILPPVFRSIAKLPELMLVTSLAWCFLVSSVAHMGGLSREMGALIAGIALSTFPYSLDVIAKVTSIRDFFVTLFFVALGMKIPMPSLTLVVLATVSALFVVGSRVVSIFPILYWMGYGHRASLLPAINLSQISEFSLIIGSLGVTVGHIDPQLVSLLIVMFAITSTASTYMIHYSHPLSQLMSRALTSLHVHDIDTPREHDRGHPSAHGKRIVFLGFFREASSVLHEFELQSNADGPHPLLNEMLIIDFNPEVHAELRRRDLQCIYGDVAHMETLHHAEIHRAELVISTISDAILKGTTNARLLEQVQRLSPQAKIVVTAESVRRALDLYQQGADYVFMPRLHSASAMAKVIELGLQEGLDKLRADAIVSLRLRNEVLP
jgi:Kef-type K+ transport system membrane component KefB